MCKLTELLNKFPELKTNSVNNTIPDPFEVMTNLSNISIEIQEDFLYIDKIMPKTTIDLKLQAQINNILRKKEDIGHIYLTLTEIQYYLKTDLDIDLKIWELKARLTKIIQQSNSPIIESNNKYYRKNIYYKEIFTANNIKQRLLIEDNNNSNFNIKNSNLSDEQIEAVRLTEIKNIMVLTGGPGTGKTFVAKTIFNNLKEQYPNKIIKVMAPTGTAAQRISDVIGCEATTIHSAIGVNNYKQTKYNNDYEADIVIIDESSMIDANLASNIFKALRIDTKLIFIGDVNQIESVQAGNFLNDIILAKIPTVKLTKIFRQAQNNPIVQFAYNINSGIEKYTNSDNLKIIKKDNNKIKDELIDRALTMYETSTNLFDTQILLPNKTGVIGIENINEEIQLYLNQNDFIENTNFKIGDKIIQIKNNYDEGVFNGNMGLIVGYENYKIKIEFKTTAQTIEVEYFNNNKILQSNIQLAYAITMHKSQGQEYKNTIIGMDDYSRIKRNLLYTAITRAKENLIIVATQYILSYAIENINHNNISRNSSLKYMLGYIEEITIEEIQQSKIIDKKYAVNNPIIKTIFTKYQSAYF